MHIEYGVKEMVESSPNKQMYNDGRSFRGKDDIRLTNKARKLLGISNLQIHTIPEKLLVTIKVHSLNDQNFVRLSELLKEDYFKEQKYEYESFFYKIKGDKNNDEGKIEVIETEEKKIVKLLEQIPDKSSLEKLSFSDLKLGNAKIAGICSTLAAKQLKIGELDLSGNDITDVIKSELAALQGCVQSLDVSGNPLDDKTLELLSYCQFPELTLSKINERMTKVFVSNPYVKNVEHITNNAIPSLASDVGEQLKLLPRNYEEHIKYVKEQEAQFKRYVALFFLLPFEVEDSQDKYTHCRALPEEMRIEVLKYFVPEEKVEESVNNNVGWTTSRLKPDEQQQYILDTVKSVKNNIINASELADLGLKLKKRNPLSQEQATIPEFKKPKKVARKKEAKDVLQKKLNIQQRKKKTYSQQQEQLDRAKPKAKKQQKTIQKKLSQKIIVSNKFQLFSLISKKCKSKIKKNISTGLEKLNCCTFN